MECSEHQFHFYTAVINFLVISASDQLGVNITANKAEGSRAKNANRRLNPDEIRDFLHSLC